MKLLDGKKGLIVGIANDYSYAYFIAEALLAHGAECLFTHLPGDKMKRRVSKAIEQLGVQDPWLESMNAIALRYVRTVDTIESPSRTCLRARVGASPNAISATDSMWPRPLTALMST